VLKAYDLAEIRDYIDWSPFFHTWELHGRFPQILEDETVGETARTLFGDGQKLLDRIVDEKLLEARAVFGIYPARSSGDDVTLFAAGGATETVATFNFLRQQMDKPPGRPNLCLADFVAPADGGLSDHLGAFAVTTGIGLAELVERFEAEHDDYQAIMAKALADRLAEAFAELLHQRVRREYWGYAAEEKLNNSDLIGEKYAGIRPAPGYPACPDHTLKDGIFELLDATAATGIELTESFAMLPAASVSGFFFAHPAASYFGVGLIGADQVEDYARRKGISLAEAKLWLATNLAE